jgi:hypothetical protein
MLHFLESVWRAFIPKCRTANSAKPFRWLLLLASARRTGAVGLRGWVVDVRDGRPGLHPDYSRKADGPRAPSRATSAAEGS